jgi:cell shape-determining protein MreC
MAAEFATRADLHELERRFEARLQLLEHIDERFDSVERQLRRLRNWAALAFLILLLLQAFVAWRIGL